MLLSLILSAPLAAMPAPMDAALVATEAPNTFRAAFVVELSSDKATRIFRFDPRLGARDQWILVSATGEDTDLDDVAASWGAESAPDGRLFPDDLRASMGERVDVDDMGAAWRVAFRHTPSGNDADMDVWAAERMDAHAWLDPVAGRFLRIDYSLPQPMRGPNGGRLETFELTYLLETDREYGMTYVSAFGLNMKASAPFRTIKRAYTARIVRTEFFFANPAARQEFLSANISAPVQGSLPR